MKHLKHLTVFIICTTILISADVPSLQADVYMYIDEDGTPCYTNYIPPSPKYKLFIKERQPRKSRPANRYDTLIKEASKKYEVDFPLLKAIMKVESNFNPKAVSRKGAMGLMQIMPGNFKSFGIKNPFDPRQNIMAGAWYFKRLLNRFNGKLHLALAAYNAGPDHVERLNSIPPISETENYVKKVIRYYNLFKKG
jgi:soluble lytic murein transglycosylase-like protein